MLLRILLYARIFIGDPPSEISLTHVPFLPISSLEKYGGNGQLAKACIRDTTASYFVAPGNKMMQKK
jgi:hypothetical protein